MTMAMTITRMRMAVMLNLNTLEAAIRVQNEIHYYVKDHTTGRSGHHGHGLDLKRLIDYSQNGHVNENAR